MAASTKEYRRSKRIRWFVAPLLLLAAIVAGSFTFFAAHATAPASPLTGNYAFRAKTTAGPKAGFYFYGSMDLVVRNGTLASASQLCALSYDKSHCSAIQGTSPDSIHVTFTVRAIDGNPAVNATGTYQTAIPGKKGSFTGFKGTFSFTTKVGISSGTWVGYRETAASITGNWKMDFYIQIGKDKGQLLKGVLSMTQKSNGQIKGTYCINQSTTCLEVRGTNTYGYLHIFIENPDTTTYAALRGTFYVHLAVNLISGSFYLPDTGPHQAALDKGVWQGKPS